jgi:hypothetical protein
MAETEEAKKPDFRNGFPVRDLADGAMALGQVDGEDVVLVRRAMTFLRSAHNALITTGRFPRAS